MGGLIGLAGQRPKPYRQRSSTDDAMIDHKLNTYLQRGTAYIVAGVLCVLCLAPSTVSGQDLCQLEEPATAELYAGNVRAVFRADGRMFEYTHPGHGYTIPRTSTVTPYFTAVPILHATVNGSFRDAGSRYRENELWPGPVDSLLAGVDCARFNRIYSITRRELDRLDSGGVPSRDMLDWPWHLGAPVVDGDGNPDNYDLYAGDRPELLGDQRLFWIMNDVGGEHTFSGSEPLGIEVHASVFSVADSDPVVGNAIYLHYRLKNKSSETLDSLYFGVFTDSDLGVAHDDYIGSDSTLSLGYTYNADNDDESEVGYGENPPATGFQVLHGLRSDVNGIDDDLDGQVDEPGERQLLTSFFAGSRNCGIGGCFRYEFPFYFRGQWHDGQSLTVGGNGLGYSLTPTNFLFHGNPPEFWSEFRSSPEEDSAIHPADRQMFLGTGPGTLLPGEEDEVAWAVHTQFGADHLDSVYKLKDAAAWHRTQSMKSLGELRGATTSVFSAPIRLSPGGGAINQPVDIELKWESTRDHDQFEMQIVQGDDIESGIIQPSSQLASLAFEQDSRYTWRMREVDALSYGPWSATNWFETGVAEAEPEHFFQGIEVIANAHGLLTPPIPAVAPGTGFPRAGESLSGQQATSGAQWVIGARMSGMCPPRCGDVREFARETVEEREGWGGLFGYDWEIRFDGAADNKALNYWGDGDLVDVPFSVWRTDQTDPTRDVRMVPLFFDDDGDDEWGLTSEDHYISPDENDPFTDWVYVYNPLDTSPGQSGYEQFIENAESNQADIDQLGGEAIARLVLIGYNLGDISDGTLNSIPLDIRLPEVGTVFRISILPVDPPVLAYPGPLDTLQPGEISFRWTFAATSSFTIQIDNDPAFESPEFHSELQEFETNAQLDADKYYWRIHAPGGGWSEVGTFVVGGTGTAVDDHLPRDHATMEVFPNPLQGIGTISIQGGESGQSSLEVFDVLGRLVRTMSIGYRTSSSRTSSQVDVSGLATGMYVFRLIVDGQPVHHTPVLIH